ncbi:MAG: hypothetical protein RBR78_00520 [Flavobacteriaceae bacterium]|jgi:hypothetical protein|nr:hypothetical protein [Flavobacteriaceae bacterium]
MKKIFTFMLLALSSAAFSNTICNEEVPEPEQGGPVIKKFWICEIHIDTDDGGCCVVVGHSTSSGSDACEKAVAQIKNDC